jgi:hypothetical protein
MSEMSNIASLLFGDPKKRELIRKIRAKTEARKVLWRKTPSAYTATAGSLLMSFVVNPGLFMSETWEVFTVKDMQGKEIIKVTNRPTAFLPGTPIPAPPTVPPGVSQLIEEANQLFTVVTQEGKGDVENAIDVIDNL